MLDSMRDTLLCFCQDVGGAKIRVKLCAPPITYCTFCSNAGLSTVWSIERALGLAATRLAQVLVTMILSIVPNCLLHGLQYPPRDRSEVLGRQEHNVEAGLVQPMQSRGVRRYVTIKFDIVVTRFPKLYPSTIALL